MGWLSAALYDWALASSERAFLGAWRNEVLTRLDGVVLEIGAGTGLNLAHYPTTVERLIVIEPDRFMRRKFVRKLRVEPESVLVVAAAAEAVPLASASVDVVVATFVLCSVIDVHRTLSEARRVLRPGGRLAFLEHVAAEAPSGRERWQRRLEPLWKRINGNCHLTRRTEAAVRDAGFTIEWERREDMPHGPGFIRPTVRGVALVRAAEA